MREELKNAPLPITGNNKQQLGDFYRTLIGYGENWQSYALKLHSRFR